MLLLIIQQEELREWHPSGVARTKIRSYQWKFQWNFDQGKGNLVWVNGEFELVWFKQDFELSEFELTK